MQRRCTLDFSNSPHSHLSMSKADWEINLHTGIKPEINKDIKQLKIYHKCEDEVFDWNK